LVAQFSMVTAKLLLVALPKVFDSVTVATLVAYIQGLTVYARSVWKCGIDKTRTKDTLHVRYIQRSPLHIVQTRHIRWECTGHANKQGT
jgi:hypothetical protein